MLYQNLILIVNGLQLYWPVAVLGRGAWFRRIRGVLETECWLRNGKTDQTTYRKLLPVPITAGPLLYGMIPLSYL